MKRILLVRPEAERDLEFACDWYEQKKSGLGREFIEEIAAAMRDLERDPEQARCYFFRFRRVLLRRFPYKIFYQSIGDRVIVFRILHAKQDHGSGLTAL